MIKMDKELIDIDTIIREIKMGMELLAEQEEKRCLYDHLSPKVAFDNAIRWLEPWKKVAP